MLPLFGKLHFAAQPAALQQLCLLQGGDDYELLFTAPPARRDAVLAAADRAATAVTRCGAVEPDPGGSRS